MSAFLFNDFFRQAPPGLDLDAIRNQWLALKPPYDVNHWRMPLPLWKQRSYDHSGEQAWEFVRATLKQESTGQGAMDKGIQPPPVCIYMHFPFCSSKCGFCDSYSYKLGGRREAVIDGYLEHLAGELRMWSEQGGLGSRPVPTVHLGGGTPTFMGERRLSRLVDCCRQHFAISPETEWALESTVQGLTPGMLETMHALGFRRLHVGVQSMEDRVRKVIGRRCPASQVLERIEAAQRLGWVVSVDLICGLPFQTLEGFIDGIQVLVGQGVNGFSLYELLIFPQNHKWAESQGLSGRSHIPNYFLFQAGASLLAGYGYEKNFFNHWADERDRNVYFTFASRGEDCLAVGAIADGVFGDYHYRHPRYAPYLRLASPGLQGGLRRNALENLLHPLVTAILSSRIPARLLPAFQAPGERGEPGLLESWLANRLVECGPAGELQLTANGAWFAGNLVSELSRRVAARFLD